MGSLLDQEDEGDRAPEAVARALAARDPQLAELLEAECMRLRDDSEANRARERELVSLAGPHQPRYRPQFIIPADAVFVDNLTCIDDDDRAYVWIYDYDIVSLSDAHPEGNDPWAHNTEARRKAIELWVSWRAQLVRSVRLCLFGGTSGMAETFRELDAAERVTHLTLRTQNEDARHAPIAQTFPCLRGLSCRGDEVAPLLVEGAPELRALVVGHGWSGETLELALGTPKLRHLGLFHSATTEADLERLATHRVLDRITSLEIFSMNHATQFPFDALLARRGAFAHVQRILLAGHLVPDDTRRRFDDWPEVDFVTWDRRETMALDFETTGWGAGAR